MLLGFEDYEEQARRLAEFLNIPYAPINVHYFPDDECKVTLPKELPEHVIFCRSLHYPNKKLIELLLAAKTARALGASKLTLVAPYLCYMRQDKAFIAGEGVSQKIIGELLAELFDNVITVDPHLHRTHDLKDAVPAKHAVALSSTTLMRAFLRDKTNTVLLGPDSESEQWVSSIAEETDMVFCVAKKQRLGDREIKISLPSVDMQDKRVVVVDDVISSGVTITIAAQQCFEKGASRVDVLVVHPLFARDALERLKQAGITEIWSSDSIPHQSNSIQLKELLGDAIKKIN